VSLTKQELGSLSKVTLLITPITQPVNQHFVTVGLPTPVIAITQKTGSLKFL